MGYSRRALSVLAATALALLAVPAGAHAGIVSFADGVYRYTGGPEANDLALFIDQDIRAQTNQDCFLVLCRAETPPRPAAQPDGGFVYFDDTMPVAVGEGALDRCFHVTQQNGSTDYTIVGCRREGGRPIVADLEGGPDKLLSRLTPGRHEVTVSGGTGNDQLRGNSGRETLDGGEGNDRIDGELPPTPGVDAHGFLPRGAVALDDIVRGGNGADNIEGGGGEDFLAGDAGTDTVSAAAGNDVVLGGAGADVLRGGAGDDLMAGNAGADRLSGEAGTNRLLGQAGRDYFYATEGYDIVDYSDRTRGVKAAIGSGRRIYEDYIQSGIEEVRGGRGNDLLIGSRGRNVLRGGAGNDRLVGGAGLDELFGESGSDTLEARDGRGGETVSCGDGSDVEASDAGDSRLGCEAKLTPGRAARRR
jgi:Ca2+-binding RTX toxin-like protein